MGDTDVENLDEFEKYKIGFTEYTIGRSGHPYGPSPNSSPTPGDPTLGYNSPALVFAERSNKGAEHLLMDQSELLDRRMNKSMSKIRTSILDIKSEMLGRRKSLTPLVSIFPGNAELPRIDSSLSVASDASLTSSASLPTIEVQQLPPFSQVFHTVPSLPNINFGFPIDEDEFTKPKPKKKPKRKKSDSFQAKPETFQRTSPEMFKLVQKVREQKRQSDSNKPNEQTTTPSLKTHAANKANREDKSVALPRVTFAIGDVDPGTKLTGTVSTEIQRVHKNTWQQATDRLMNASRKVKGGLDSLTRYNGSYSRSSSTSNLRMSYCQSSYTERSERDRIENVMRRHTSQTKTGPVDFNKIKRQLGIKRSTTMVW